VNIGHTDSEKVSSGFVSLYHISANSISGLSAIKA